MPPDPQPRPKALPLAIPGRIERSRSAESRTRRNPTCVYAAMVPSVLVQSHVWPSGRPQRCAADPRIDRCIKNVHDQVVQDVESRHNEDEPLDGGVVIFE